MSNANESPKVAAGQWQGFAALRKGLKARIYTGFVITVAAFLILGGDALYEAGGAPSTSEGGHMLSWVLLLGAALLGVGLAFWTTRGVSRSFEGLAAAARGLADEQHVDIPYLEEDSELGELARSLSQIQSRSDDVQRIKIALDGCQTNVMVADVDLNIVYMNETMVAMMKNAESDLKTDLPNLDASDLMGKCVDIFHKNPAHQRGMIKSLNSAYKTSIEVGGRTFNLIASPVVDDGGNRLGTVVEWDDVTAKLAEEREQQRIAAENLRTKIALDGCQTNVMVADTDLNIVYMNETMVEMMKNAESDLQKDLPDLRANDLMGKCVDIFHKNPAYQRGMIEKLNETYRTSIEVGGDLPGWLPDLVGRSRLAGLTDRRGECIHSACEHYRRCFIERSIRRARHAELVVANHALVMVQAALGGAEEGRLPQRYVFDEGHHLFNAADSAFAVHLSGQETHELRRWLRGNEAGGRSASRIRGLKRRIEDLVAADEDANALLSEGLAAARALPSEGWRQRLAEGTPQGPAEAFLALISKQVYARCDQPKSPYSLETEAKPPLDGLLDKAGELAEALERLHRPLNNLHARLAARLEDEAEDLDSDYRRRIEGACRSLKRRALWPLRAWREMLEALEADTPEPFVDWFAVERSQGRDRDVGFFRHWKDPTEPFAETVLSQAHGAAVTSATLTDGSGEAEEDWAGAVMRSGAAHLAVEPYRARVPSPFDYGAQTRVLIVTDVRKDDLGQVAAAYRTLFEAAAGGGLGLFTAISRLRGVHERIAGPLEASGLPLYAQHVDPMDVATLVDIFRAEPDSCLLGTDALRDGVDVPGAALRLIVFDRVPWPRPDIRHRARREIFGGRRYDDQLARLRIKQAYGRLIRRADDRGVFVLLDPMTPSRLLTALPEGVTPQRVGLAETVAEVTSFLGMES